MTETDNQRGDVCNPCPIGYVVLMKLSDGEPWEPAALTKYADDAAKQLLARTCFSMFPTEESAEQALRQLQGEPWVPGVEVRICAVFPANIAAPHAKEAERSMVMTSPAFWPTRCGGDRVEWPRQ